MHCLAVATAKCAVAVAITLHPAHHHQPVVTHVGHIIASTSRREHWQGHKVTVVPTPAPVPPVPVVTDPAPANPLTGGSVTPSSAYEACVIRRESGGNPSAVNPSSGAGGLYQFLPSTWASLGYSGLPQDAPASVQQQAFDKLYAQAGTSPWSPSDGC
jgi:resuscitation-promoting factor RpfC